MTDAQLVREALAGGNGAYEQLVRRWSPRVTAVCHARVGRDDSADDLAQETLLRALRSLPSLADPEKFGAWICGIAARTCLDWLKAKRRGAQDSSRDLADFQGNDGAAAAEQQDEIARLMAEVEKLPMPYRQVLMHYYYEDCTYEQLAELLGISAATVNARLTKARQLLRERMGVDQPGKQRA